MARGEVRDLRTAVAATLVLGAIGAIMLPLFTVHESGPQSVAASAADARGMSGAGAGMATVRDGGYRILRASWDSEDAGEEAEPEWGETASEDVSEEVERLGQEARKRWQNLDIAVGRR